MWWKQSVVSARRRCWYMPSQNIALPIPNSEHYQTLLTCMHYKRSHWGAFECKKLYPEPREAAGEESGFVRRTIICWNWNLISATTPPPGCRLQIEETFPCLNFQYARKNMMQTTQLPRKVSWYYVTFFLYNVPQMSSWSQSHKSRPPVNCIISLFVSETVYDTGCFKLIA